MAEVVTDDLSYRDGRPGTNESVQFRLLAYHPPFIKEEAGIVGWGNSQHITSRVAVYPIGGVVPAGADGCKL